MGEYFIQLYPMKLFFSQWATFKIATFLKVFFAGKCKGEKSALPQGGLSKICQRKKKKRACPQKTLEHYLIKKKDSSEIQTTEDDHGKHSQ